MNAWAQVNADLIAKAIGELTFEETISPKKSNDSYVLTLKSGVTYIFTGWMTIWNYLRVDASSITRSPASPLLAADFFIDAQAETAMDDIILANFLEELHQTLFSDLKLLELKKTPVEELLNSPEIESALNGHPKILLNKGRIGFGEEALALYAPESKTAFQLRWLLVSKTLLTGDMNLAPLSETIQMPEGFALLPVHPWQWDHIIKIQYMVNIAAGEILDLGIRGDYYRPQISIRTLTNVSCPGKPDIKLPLSILNTSCVRGLPPKAVSIGPAVSSILDSICTSDPLLHARETTVLKEFAGLSVAHSSYKKIPGAPYRYNEYFGAVWRTSAKSLLGENEKHILTAALFHTDSHGNSVIGRLIGDSGLQAGTWLRQYFDATVIPLYHLQSHYGVGLVAHGQNITLRLRNSAPAGIFLKDFQGDLRLSSPLTSRGEQFFGVIANELTTLAPKYLLHDLITGHMNTVMRFLSAVMEEEGLLSEKEFYRILRQSIEAYILDYPVEDELDLLTNNLDRVLLNKVRFKIGYADSAARPLPMVGTPLPNPMLTERL